MAEPGIDVLTEGRERQAKEPTVATGRAGLKQVKVVLLALDRAFSRGASVGMKLPEVAVSGDACV